MMSRSVLLTIALVALLALQADAYLTQSKQKITSGTRIARTKGLATASACADLCVANPDCTHAGAFRRRKDTTWTCALYSAVTSQQSASRSVVFVMDTILPVARTYQEYAANTVQIASHYASRKEMNLDSCKRLCDMEPSCGAVSQRQEWCRFHDTNDTPKNSVSYTVWVAVNVGCMNSLATNYDATAVLDDGSCTMPGIVGCSDMDATNYDESVTTHDPDLCAYPPAVAMTPYPGQQYKGGVYVRRVNGANKQKCQSFCIKAGDGCQGVNSKGSKCWVYSTNHHEQGSLVSNAQFTYYAKEKVGCTNSSALNFDPMAQVEADPSTCRMPPPGSLSGGTTTGGTSQPNPTPSPPPGTQPPGFGNDDDPFPYGFDHIQNSYTSPEAIDVSLLNYEDGRNGLAKQATPMMTGENLRCPWDVYIVSCADITEVTGDVTCNAFFDNGGTCESNGSGGCQVCSGTNCPCRSTGDDDPFHQGRADIIEWSVDSMNKVAFGDDSGHYGSVTIVSYPDFLTAVPAVETCPFDVYVPSCLYVYDPKGDVTCGMFYDDQGTCVVDPMHVSCNPCETPPCPCAQPGP